MLSEVVTCNCIVFETHRGHAESNPRPSEEGVSFYLIRYDASNTDNNVVP